MTTVRRRRRRLQVAWRRRRRRRLQGAWRHRYRRLRATRHRHLHDRKPSAAVVWLEPMDSLVKHMGGCHCGRVRFEVHAPARVEVSECNCSMCSRTGFQHLIVPGDRFRLVQGADALTTYAFNTQTAKHLFCSACGIKSFYVPRSHPDGFSVNARCLDEGTLEITSIRRIDGRNWERMYPGGRGEYRD